MYKIVFRYRKWDYYKQMLKYLFCQNEVVKVWQVEVLRNHASQLIGVRKSSLGIFEPF